MKSSVLYQSGKNDNDAIAPEDLTHLRSPAPTPTAERALGRFWPKHKVKLREQLAEVMWFKHFSHRTERAYWHWIKGFILFHQKRHPRDLGAAATQAKALCWLRVQG